MFSFFASFIFKMLLFSQTVIRFDKIMSANLFWYTRGELFYLIIELGEFAFSNNFLSNFPLYKY